MRPAFNLAVTLLGTALLVSGCVAYQPRVNATRPTTKPGYSWDSMRDDLETCERRAATVTLMYMATPDGRRVSAYTLRQLNFEDANECLRDKGWK